MTPSDSTLREREVRQRNTFLLSLALAVTMAVILGLSISEDIGNQTTFLTDNNLFIAIPLLTGVAAMWLGRRGWPERAGLVLSAGIAVGALGSITTVSELGLV